MIIQEGRKNSCENNVFKKVRGTGCNMQGCGVSFKKEMNGSLIVTGEKTGHGEG